MAAMVKTLRIPDDTRLAIEEMCRRTGRDFSSVANEMLSEAVKMRRFPGLVFADGPTGRRARLGGTGIDMWEVVRAYRDMDGDWDRLRTAYHWLSELQLRLVLAYAEAFPGEIDARIAADERWTPDAIWSAYPFTRPRG